MERLGELWRRLLFLLRRRQFERDLEEEMRFHLGRKAEEASHQHGSDSAAACCAARRAFGNRTRIAEDARAAWGWSVVDQVVMDLRYASRILRRNPVFSVVAVLALALGIGATTALYSLVDTLLVNPYRFPDAGRLVDVNARHISGKNSATGFADYLDWRDQNHSFEEMAIEPWVSTQTLTGFGDARRITVCRSTASLFPLLRMSPNIGRTFAAEEDRPGGPRVVVLSEPVWRRVFGGEPGVLGRTVTLDDTPHTIIGVMPAAFRFPGMRACELWAPLRESGGAGRYQHQYGVWARLKPGVTIEQAQADMTATAHRLEEAYPATNKGWGIKVRLPRDVLAAQVRSPLAVLGAGVTFVLLLVCANVAGLLLARGSARTGEIAIRASIGASRMRLVRQMLTESLLLAVLACGLGLLVARWLMQFAMAAVAPSIGLDGLLVLDARIAGFAIALSIATTLIFGLVPALHGSNTDWNSALKGGLSPAGTRSRRRALSALVVGEIAISIVLLAGAGFLTRGVLAALKAELGLRAEHVLTFALDLPRARYPGGRAAAFYQDLLSKLRNAPGVEAAGGVGTLPMTSGFSGSGFDIEGGAAPADWMAQTTQLNQATPDYFRAVGIPILRGRSFDDRDTAASPPVVMIDQTFARTYFAGEDPVGRRIRITGTEWMTITGVVGAVKHQQPNRAPVPQLYRPYAQAGEVSWIALRTIGDPEGLAGLARKTVRALDQNIPVLRMRTMREVVSDSLEGEQLMARCVAVYAAFALLLSAIGIYGVIAYAVNQRRHEIGIRIALGASHRSVMGMVTRQGVALSLVGGLIGLPLALMASRALASHFMWVTPWDVPVLATAAAVLIVMALAASWLPARRASRVDPAAALRRE